MQRVLLTGGAGFIGSHLTKRYVDEGYDTIVVDNLSSGKYNNIKEFESRPNFHFEKLDITDKEALRKVFEKYHPTIINHHAAQKSVPNSIKRPLYDLQINGVGLLNVLTLVEEYPIDKFIFVSSGGALSKEINAGEKSRETDMPQFMSSYAITKFSGENYVKLYAKRYGFSYTILRYANVYGTNQTMDGECGVVPIFVNNILQNKSSILMTYDDMPRGCTRDYVNAEDLGDINMLVTEKSANRVLNIGSGKEISILDIYDIIQKVFGTNLSIDIIGPREGDVKRSVLDISLVQELYNWSPKVEFEEGIQKIYDSIYKNMI